MGLEVDHLLCVAGEIAEGAPIAWEEEARRASDERDAQALRGLQDLEAVVSAHRRIKRAYDSATTPADTPIGTGGTEPRRWGHLHILNTIGEGSFGTVYRAYDGRLAIDVALKLLSRSYSARSANSTRILEEARLLARVRHPNVVTVYGADQTQDRVGLWMEFVQGRTLAELLRTRGPFGIQDTVSIGRDLCRAAAAVHQAGFLHGDIKAHNVMRQENGRIVLMDFGAGRALTHDAVRGRVSVTGTPLYLAPEVLDGRPQGTSSDIYALGVLLYHLVTGSYPVIGESPADLADSHKRGDRRRLDDARADLPDDFVRVVERATAADPAHRFASAEALEDALVRVSSLPVGRHGIVQRARVLLAPVPRWVVALAAAAVLVAGGAMVVWPDSPAVATPPLATSPGTERPATPVPAAAPAAAATYEITAAFYRAGPNGDQLLQPGSPVAPGDQLFLKLEASVPLNVYVVNEDERGEAYLLFPLPGHRLTNPLPARESVSLPRGVPWIVTTAGGREHFLVFASPDRLESFEPAFAALPSPRENAPVAARLQATTIERLRGVGGLAPDASRQKAGAGLSRLFTTPLTNARESARGLWVRQITLDNPAR